LQRFNPVRKGNRETEPVLAGGLFFCPKFVILKMFGIGCESELPYPFRQCEFCKKSRAYLLTFIFSFITLVWEWEAKDEPIPAD